ncbi:hypothetical protein KEM55_001280, partial [Ascosphaera atra]
RDKIRTWQKQSGGAGRIADVLPHDIPRETGGGFADAAARRKSFPVPEPEEPRKSRRERTKTDISFTVHEPEPSRDKPATIRPEHDQGYDGETELSGAPGRRPKKRVISDGHWRKDRHAPKPTKSKDVQPRKKNELLDSYTARGIAAKPCRALHAVQQRPELAPWLIRGAGAQTTWCLWAHEEPEQGRTGRHHGGRDGEGGQTPYEK